MTRSQLEEIMIDAGGSVKMAYWLNFFIVYGGMVSMFFVAIFSGLWYFEFEEQGCATVCQQMAPVSNGTHTYQLVCTPTKINNIVPGTGLIELDEHGNSIER